MTRTESIKWLRRTVAEGRHLNNCMADAGLREHGRRMVERAKRVARRLGVTLWGLGVDA